MSSIPASTPENPIFVNPPGFPPAIDETNLSPGHYIKTLILNEIFKLLTQMVGTLQNVAAAQAARLNFLTQWQKAYTDLQNQVHTFVKGNGDGVNGNTSAQGVARDDLNRANSTYIQNLQNQNSVISDDAKALQSTINQTVDQVQQQSDLATSILQEMSTILSTIFR